MLRSCILEMVLGTDRAVEKHRTVLGHQVKGPEWDGTVKIIPLDKMWA